ncbi:transcriptional regulator with XRE-family HTH domain [Sporomusaceae bacterium BoRhaA]|uniref:helix-turn-helix domain-containing protein n=1 Tax=Pelorhabdus rhamnosifermentans TaxID=2772457 RepID=UPI001C0613BE|nr:helix-turn-helix transcriptional regulator [Pelorhabdus rhamnosifermentans]MBU2701743.1 transcriptional regulator with XRE-family HTH domain [Pelorhabdus rhamnosifermentans]
MSFGERLKYLRENRELTQRALANLIKIGYSTLAMYETNKRQPDFDILNKLASFFDVTTDYLLERTNDSKPLTEKDKIITLKSSKEASPQNLKLLEIARKLEKLPPEKRKALETLFGVDEQNTDKNS